MRRGARGGGTRLAEASLVEHLFDESDLFADSVADRWITLPQPALTCFELFADVGRWREWLPVVSRVSGGVGTARGGSSDVSMTLVMMKMMLGCRLRFEVDPAAMTVTWESHPSSRFRWSGAVSFEVSSERQAIMRYRVETGFSREVGVAITPPDARSFVDCFRGFVRTVLPALAEGSAPHVLPRAPVPRAGAGLPPPPPPAALLAVSPRRVPAGPAASPLAPARATSVAAAAARPMAGALELSGAALRWLS